MHRKEFLKLAGLSGLAALHIEGLAATQTPAVADSPSEHGRRPTKAQVVYVPAGTDRSKERLLIWGAIPLQIKVSSQDTNGALFVFEHADMSKGGPPRHFHYDQDEWFYAIAGDFAFEVGGERFTLRPGDSLFAPRLVPHAWAYIGEQPGTLILAVQPAGSLEAFFRKSADMTTLPTPVEAEQLFAAHGMRVVGPPLDVAPGGR